MKGAFILIREALPLTIREAEWADPVLTLAGEGWSLAASCPWRVTSNSGLEISDSHPDAVDLVWELVGVSVRAAQPQNNGALVDPRFILSNDTVLELFSTFSSDAWTLRLPTLTIVGPLSPDDLAGSE